MLFHKLIRKDYRVDELIPGLIIPIKDFNIIALPYGSLVISARHIIYQLYYRYMNLIVGNGGAQATPYIFYERCIHTDVLLRIIMENKNMLYFRKQLLLFRLNETTEYLILFKIIVRKI